MNMSVDLGGGIVLEHPLGLGAGVCKRLDGDEGAEEFSRSAASFVTLGSYTVDPKLGNEGDVLYHGEGFTLNSLGLPNVGMEQLRTDLPGIISTVEDAGKLVVVSVAGNDAKEYADLVEMAIKAGADVVEINLGCPNVITAGGGRKEIVSYDPDLVHQTLVAVEERIGDRIFIWLKMSPLDPKTLRDVAPVISESSLVDVVVGCNAWPSAFFTENGESVITPGYAGMAGGALLSMALGNIRQWRELLPERIRLIGVGGISGGDGVAAYLQVGADAVAMVSHVVTPGNGPKVFSEVLQEYVEGLKGD